MMTIEPDLPYQTDDDDKMFEVNSISKSKFDFHNLATFCCYVSYYLNSARTTWQMIN